MPRRVCRFAHLTSSLTPFPRVRREPVSRYAALGMAAALLPLAYAGATMIRTKSFTDAQVCPPIRLLRYRAMARF